MRTVTFKSVLETIAALFGDDPDAMQAANLARWARFVNRRLGRAWVWDYWPELTPCELRAYRDVYSSAAAYTAGTVSTPVEVYFPAARKYYQCIRDSSGHAPILLSDATIAVDSDGDVLLTSPEDPGVLQEGSYTVNSAFWAESALTYSGPDWTNGLDQEVGDVVRRPADGRFYACHTAHNTGDEFDAASYGVLTEFEPYVALAQTGRTKIGEVLRCARANPRVQRGNPDLVNFTLSDRGIVPNANQPVLLWVEFRRRVPQFTTRVWSNTETYATGSIVYWPATGECYTALQEATNQNPATQTTYWEKHDFPAILADYVAQAAYADSLRPQGRNDDAAGEDNVATEFLLQAHDAAFAGQGQYDTAAVRTY